MSASAPQTDGGSKSTITPARDGLASLRIERPEPYRSRRSGTRWLRWLTLLLLLGGAGYGIYSYALAHRMSPADLLSDGSRWMPEMMQNRIEVRLVSVTIQQGRAADALVVASGYLQSKQQAGIGARAAGRVDRLYFEEGSQVKKGDVLAELEHNELKATQDAASASVARAKAASAEQQISIEQTRLEADRADKLWGSRSISESEFDQARFAHRTAVARLATLQAEIALAEAQLQQVTEGIENMFIRAPFDGTVISKDAELGESILPGGLGVGSGRGSVATIADLQHLRIECDVKEDFISRIREGQEADISVDAVPDKKYHGHVYKIIPMGDRARATIEVQVEIDDADHLLFPEMSGTAFFLPQQDSGEISDAARIFCPATSVAGLQGEQAEGDAHVWTIDAEKRARKLPVKVGPQRNGDREVFRGLTGSERVVANPKGLREGTPLKIAD